MFPGLFTTRGGDYVGVRVLAGGSPPAPPLVNESVVFQFVAVFAFWFLVALAVFFFRELRRMRDPAPTRFVWNALRRRGGLATFVVLQVVHLALVLAVVFRLMKGAGWVLAWEGGDRAAAMVSPQMLAFLGPAASWVSLLSLLVLASLFLSTWKHFRQGVFAEMRLTGTRPAEMLRPLVWMCFALDALPASARWIAAIWLLADPGAARGWLAVLPVALACRLAVSFGGFSLLARAVTVRWRWQAVAEPVAGLIGLQLVGAAILDGAAEATFSHRVQLSDTLLGATWYQYGERVTFNPLPLEVTLACCVLGTLFLFAGVAWYSAAMKRAADFPVERPGRER